MIELQSKDPIPIKLVIVGDGAVGKTCILVRYLSHQPATHRSDSPQDTNRQFSTIFPPLSRWITSWSIQAYGKDLLIQGHSRTGRVQQTEAIGISSLRCVSHLFLGDRSSIFCKCHEKGLFFVMQWFPELEECVPTAPKIFVGNKIDLR